MIIFSSTEDGVISCTNEYYSCVGMLIRQEPCNGWMFQAYRPLCFNDIKYIEKKMSELCVNSKCKGS
jgi:hypothetical protein